MKKTIKKFNQEYWEEEKEIIAAVAYHNLRNLPYFTLWKKRIPLLAFFDVKSKQIIKAGEIEQLFYEGAINYSFEKGKIYRLKVRESKKRKKEFICVEVLEEGVSETRLEELLETEKKEYKIEENIGTFEYDGIREIYFLKQSHQKREYLLSLLVDSRDKFNSYKEIADLWRSVWSNFEDWIEKAKLVLVDKYFEEMEEFFLFTLPEGAKVTKEILLKDLVLMEAYLEVGMLSFDFGFSSFPEEDTLWIANFNTCGDIISLDIFE